MLARRVIDPIRKDLEKKMVLLAGPRQCGKTTLTRKGLWDSSERPRVAYLNWDFEADRKKLKNLELPFDRNVWILDEIHKYKPWKNWLKGLYDKFHDEHSILVTGSARLDAYSRGGDSLQGRYFKHHLHPLTLSELDSLPAQDYENRIFQPPERSAHASTLESLMKLGGFPEPFLSGSEREAKRWRSSYSELLVREDVRALEQIVDLDSMQTLYERLPATVGSPLSINSLREDLEKNHQTISNWIKIFERLYGVFRIPPFGGDKIKAVKKEQKLYFWDWGQVGPEPARFENCIAVHLMRFCDWMQDVYGEKYELRYYKSTLNQEVDFILMHQNKPVAAIEAKSSDEPLHPALKYLLERVDIPQAFQVSLRGRQDSIRALDHGKKVRFIPAIKFLAMLP